jgi:hypothetical protein
MLCQALPTTKFSNRHVAFGPEPDDYAAVLASSIVLELTDDTEEGKLLGITVDLDYDNSDDN